MFGRSSKPKKNESASREIVRQDPRTRVTTTTAQSETTNTTVNTATIFKQSSNTVELRTTQQRITHQQFAGIAEITIRRTPTPAELAELLGNMNMSRESVRGVSAKSKPSAFKSNRNSFGQSPTTPTIAKSHSSSVTQSQGRSVTTTLEQQVFSFKDLANGSGSSYPIFDRSKAPSSSTSSLPALSWTKPAPKPGAAFNTAKPMTSVSSSYVSPYSGKSFTPPSQPKPKVIAPPSRTIKDARPIVSAYKPTASSKPAPAPSVIVSKSSLFGSSTPKAESPKVAKSKLKPGCAFILNNERFDNKQNEFRVGSRHDVQRIRKSLEAFKLSVDVLENATVKQIESLVAKLEKKDFSKYSCLVITILSHGNRHDEVAAKDGNYSIDDHIVFPILRNRTLEDKPKIFFIQACKGDLEKGSFKKDAALPQGSPNEILKCYSTFEGYVAYRTEEGSPFIQMLAERIQKDGHRKSITEILDAVREYVKGLTGGRQIPSVTTTLTRPFVFGDYC